MKVRGHQWESTGSYSYYSGNWEDKLCTHQGGANNSTPKTLPNFTILVLLLLLCISTVRGSLVQVAEEDK